MVCLRAMAGKPLTLYLTEDRDAFVRAESARLKIPIAKFYALLLDDYRRKNRPIRACVGLDRVSWTLPLDLKDAQASHAQALAVYPKLEIYLIPEGQSIAPGSVIPAEWEAHAPGL